MKCPTCNGEGVVMASDNMPTECHDCHGFGFIPDETQDYGNDCPGGKCEF